MTHDEHDCIFRAYDIVNLGGTLSHVMLHTPEMRNVILALP